MSTIPAPPTTRPADATWRRRFTTDRIWVARVATRNPGRGLVISTQGDLPPRLNAWAVTTGDLRPAAGDGEGVGFAAIDPPGEYLYFLTDTGGDELGHLCRVPFGGGTVEDVTPDLPPYTLRGIGFSADGRTVMLNPINADGFGVHAVDVSGEHFRSRLVYRDTWETWGALSSADGDLVSCWSTAKASGIRQHTLLVFDAASAELVGELDDGREAGVSGVAFSPVPGDSRLLAQTTRSGFVRPLVWNPRTGRRDDLELADTGDVVPIAWSPDGRAVLLCQPGGAQRLHRFDLDAGTDRPLNHRAGTYFNELLGGPSFPTPDTIVGVCETALTPGGIVEIDAHDGHLRRVLVDQPAAPKAHPWRSVVFPSADNTPIQAFVATPDGDGPFPTIVEMHGGPHLSVNESYQAGAAAWVDNGYAWISPNFRGSSGFGRAFREQIWGAMGAKELDDMAAAREFMVRQGIADPDLVFAHGTSYGGYLTLLAVGRQPDLWAAGLAIAALADLAAAFDQCSDALRGALTGWMRGTPTERPEAYAKSSPITYAADVRVPVFVAQLENDTRTPSGQLRNYEKRLTEHGKQIEVAWYGGGHMSYTPATVLSIYERMFAFAAKVIAQTQGR